MTCRKKINFLVIFISVACTVNSVHAMNIVQALGQISLETQRCYAIEADINKAEAKAFDQL